MLSSLILIAALPLTLALPSKRQATPSDTDILQYALTLEHLENAFYSGALEQFDAGAFGHAGYPNWVRQRFQQIADHEATHVSFLAGALGDAATKACEYSFPYTDPKSFVALAGVLEGVGTAAYLGAAQFIKTPAYLTAAGAILTTETRHTAWIKSAVGTNAGWSGAFDTPLGLSNVYSLAAGFITSCPESNPDLPVKAFPALTTTNTPVPGQLVTFDFDAAATNGAPLYAAFFSGLTTLYSALDASHSAVVPESLIGTVYVVISTSNTAVTDDNTIAGPTIFEFRLPETTRQTS